MKKETVKARQAQSIHLDLPFDNLLSAGANILIAGMGGGFDVFCGLPLFFELRKRGYTVHLANVSFSALSEYQDGEWLSQTLVGVGPASPEMSGYHPERFLARWFRDSLKEEMILWCLDPGGALTLADDFQRIVDRLGIDAIVLVDGGVDSLTRGDEELVGTVLEDYASLAAVELLKEVPVRVMACIGMGVEGDVSHSCVLENIAALTQQGGFLGAVALLALSEAFQRYEEAVTYVHSQPGQQPSVVNASVISSALGHFGDFHLTERTRGSQLWISPLMSLVWFFTVEKVAAQNLFLKELQKSRTAGETFGIIYEAREGMTLRPAGVLPLS